MYRQKAPPSKSAGFHGEVTEFFYTGLALDGRQAERVLLVVMSSLNCHFINRKSPNKIFLFSFAKVFFKYFGNINGHKWRKFTVQTIYKSMFSSNVAVWMATLLKFWQKSQNYFVHLQFEITLPDVSQSAYTQGYMALRNT